jgi:hypothetical protein
VFVGVGVVVIEGVLDNDDDVLEVVVDVKVLVDVDVPVAAEVPVAVEVPIEVAVFVEDVLGIEFVIGVDETKLPQRVLQSYRLVIRYSIVS